MTESNWTITEIPTQINLVKYFGLDNEEEMDTSSSQMSVKLWVFLGLLFLFLVISSLILVFVVVRNMSIKQQIDKQDEINLEKDQSVKDKSIRSQSEKAIKKSMKDNESDNKNLENRISIYSSGQTVSTNAVIDIEI